MSTDDFDGVTPDMLRAAEKRAAAIAAERGDDQAPAAAEPVDPEPKRARRQTTR